MIDINDIVNRFLSFVGSDFILDATAHILFVVRTNVVANVVEYVEYLLFLFMMMLWFVLLMLFQIFFCVCEDLVLLLLVVLIFQNICE